MERVTYEDLGPLVAALQAGRTVAIPTDTVYGLACAAHDRVACEALLRSKGRSSGQPTAIVGGTVAGVLEAVLPDLPEAAQERVRRLLPGPLTLVLPNPGRRYRWLCGADPERIGLRVPELDPRLAAAIDRVPALLLTSANVTGAAPAVAFADLAPVAPITAVALDGGTCPGGIPSTVVDVTGAKLEILREGPVGLAEIRDRL
jgi:L-threonylcarbamoyladenylate synthase